MVDIFPKVNSVAKESEIKDIISQQLNNDEFDRSKVVIKNLIFETDFNFVNIKISNIEFKDCLFRKANFRHTIFTDVSFLNCKMCNADFSNSKIRCVNFCETTFGFASKFRESNIQYSTFIMCDISAGSFTDSNIKGVNFIGAVNLEHCDFSDCEITKTVFKNCNLTNGSFSNVVFDNSQFIESNMIGTKLSGSTGLLNPVEFITKKFERCGDLIFVYAPFEFYDETYLKNLKPYKKLENEVNYDRTLNSNGGGFTVYNKEGIKNYLDSRVDSTNDSHVWECVIPLEFLSLVVVPYTSINSFRTGHIILNKKITDFSFFYK